MGAAAAFAATAFTPRAAAAAEDPPPGRVLIEVATVNGAGCPAGTVAVAVAPDNAAFTITFGSVIAQVGLGSKPSDSLKSCQVRLSVHPPQGYTYALDGADYAGMVHLAKGASGEVTVDNYVQGTPPAPRKRTFTGPVSENWQLSGAPDPVVYAPCSVSQAFNLSFALRVNAGTSDTSTTTSFLTLESTDGSDARLVYHLAWKRCPGS
ncbi:hypothetical protein GCM10010324_56320 [Streptomyces hiroshimensis]|uniref:DUF4360 domain-containing protein n=2 Tax=Streptomyces hiroshimensis TaxID=66424 RepID=A0ABQ2Z4F9_9ACTN|nr:hypothetical protein GCM10010324_56320 [Streptomyces hiroshimensis]